MNEIDNSIVEMLLKVELKPNNQDTRNKIQTNNNNQISKSKHIGRNDPCPCGATHADVRPIKYKHCCGKNA